MNPLVVDNWKSALMAFGVGFVVAAVMTVFLHYGSTSLNTLAGKVAGTS